MTGNDTHGYKGWLNSDSFWKRMWAVYGHSMFGGLIILAIIYLICFLLIFLFG